MKNVLYNIEMSIVIVIFKCYVPIISTVQKQLQVFKLYHL